MKKALDYLTAKPARFFLLAALIWGGLMCYLNSKDVGENGFSWHDLLVEANGMVFDLLVFGILLSVYEALREKKEKIERLYEELDDYRWWDDKEATLRILGAIRRLIKAGVQMSEINLKRCFLSEVNFWNHNFSGVIFDWANLSRASLWKADLSRASLWKADLSGADLAQANLSGAHLGNANLSGALLLDTILSGTDLSGADLSRALVGLDNWFEKLEDWKVIGREEIIEKYIVDEKGKLQLKLKNSEKQ